MKFKRLLVFAGLGLCLMGILFDRVFSPPAPVESPRAASDVPAPVRFSAPSAASTLIPRSGAPRISPADPSAAVLKLLGEIQQAFASTNLETREFALTNLLAELVQQDAAAAGRLAETITDPDLREEVFRRVAQLWAAQDPASALTWAGALTFEFERDSALNEVCLHLAGSDPAAAFHTRERLLTDGQPHA
ncbi:MAG: hypothetical protein H7Y43_06985, partial [Akkermansiaceae bacterium]|nr:hypothetical protein [Verrucomicrobiales bacterium]